MGERGLIRRQGDPEDRRRVRVYLTDEGRALARRLVADARAHEQKLLQMLEGGDGARIKLALSSLIERLAPPGENEK
jgi:DNA-binding MarR family transcriptional regulator